MCPFFIAKIINFNIKKPPSSSAVFALLIGFILKSKLVFMFFYLLSFKISLASSGVAISKPYILIIFAILSTN